MKNILLSIYVLIGILTGIYSYFFGDASMYSGAYSIGRALGAAIIWPLAWFS